MADLKQVAPTSPYYEPIRSLVERYGGYIALSPASFDPFAALTAQDLATLERRYFGTDRVASTLKSQGARSRIVARGELCEMLAAGFEAMRTLIPPG
jgi:hypothetical protein